MAASSLGTSGPPSSSAVTIPVPGKSILKKPPPQQQSLFSRITRFLPTQSTTLPASSEEEKPLKRAHFILPQIAIVYPISSLNPPSTPTLKDEKRAIEDQEAERRRKIVRGSQNGTVGQEVEEWWSMDKVDAFYRECCAGCEEEPDPAISAAFKVCSVLKSLSTRIFCDIFSSMHRQRTREHSICRVYNLMSYQHRYFLTSSQLNGGCGNWYFGNVILTNK